MTQKVLYILELKSHYQLPVRTWQQVPMRGLELPNVQVLPVCLGTALSSLVRLTHFCDPRVHKTGLLSLVIHKDESLTDIHKAFSPTEGNQDP